MNATQANKDLLTKAHEYATQHAMAYVAKFTRPVVARAVDSVYQMAFANFLRSAT
jgi:hypothetical protein